MALRSALPRILEALNEGVGCWESGWHFKEADGLWKFRCVSQVLQDVIDFSSFSGAQRSNLDRIMARACREF